MSDAAGAAPARRSLGERAAAVLRRVDELEAALVQTKRQTFQDVVNFPPALLDHYLFVARQADEAEPTTQGIADRLADLDAEWARQRAAVAAVMARDVAELNRLAREAGVPAIVVPAVRTVHTASG